MRPASSSWIPIKLTSIPISSYSPALSVLISLQLFLGSLSTAFFPFLNMYFCLRLSSFLVSKPYVVSVASLWGPTMSLLLFFTELLSGPFSLMLHPDDLYFLALPTLLSKSVFTELLVTSSPTTSFSPIHLLLLEASLFPPQSHSDSLFLVILLAGPLSSNILSHFRFDQT